MECYNWYSVSVMCYFNNPFYFYWRVSLMNSVIDQIKVRIMYSSVKALFVKNEVGNYAWIPKSIIHNSYNENDNELFQVLQVEKWFLDKNKQIYEWG